MPNNKKRHFVPQFYLRNFSYDAQKKFINIFHIKSGKHIHNGMIKNQAQKDYFYGSELAFENALSDIESETSLLIETIIQRGEVPKYLSADYQTLLMYCIFQHHRTLYAADAMDEQLDKTVKIIFKSHSEIGPHLDNYLVHFTEPAKFVLSIAASIVPLAYDLRMKLIINKSESHFVTSDNPCVFINPFLRIKRSFGGKHGIASKGLIILLPISPDYAIIIYDDYRYKIGGKNMKPVIISNPMDIEEINKLQFLNAHKSIYYKDVLKSKDDINVLAHKYSSQRRDEKVNVDEYIKNDGSSSLIHAYDEEIKASFEPSFLKLTPMAEKEVVRQPAEQVRDYHLCTLFHKFQEDVKKGKYTVSQFFEYINKKS